jgi:dTDP-4-amino-4,6-dideoxygalactose transaminase
MSDQIPLSRPYFDAQELEAVRRVLDSGWVVQGPEVAAFEAEITRLHHVRHCIAVSSGTAALQVCYLALGIGPGDAVFIPSFAWPSAANMARLVGAQPIFVDVLRHTYNIDPDDLARRIESCLGEARYKPRAVVPVHEFGLAADMDKVLAVAAKYSLVVIEDAACALGATYGNKPVGTFGKLGIFSFHPRKSITTGEGGAIVTNEIDLAEQCRCWRNHGQRQVNGQRDFFLPGLNYRMTEMQAAIGRVQLTKFASILLKRRSLVSEYLEKLKECPDFELPGEKTGDSWNSSLGGSGEHTWQTLMVVLPERFDRGKVLRHLAQDGIEAGPGSVAAHLSSYFQPQPVLPVSELLHHHGLALPLHPGLSIGQVNRVVESLRKHLDHCERSVDLAPPYSARRSP